MGLGENRIEILEICENAIKKSGNIKGSEAHIIKRRMAQQIYSRAKNIHDICEVEKYDLYFNGKVGLGKSTAISTLFNLINRDNLKRDNRLATALLLKTGSGRTTVCETKIVPNCKKSYISVDPVSEEEFDIYLEEFCKWLKSQPTEISEEELRVIKNMSAIPLKHQNPEEILENISVTEEGLYQYLKNVVKYDKRIKVQFNKPSDERFETWLKNIYEKINDGKIKDCPMPLNITIYIREKDFKLNIPMFIKSIVDTRGIDGGERADIQNYITKKDSLSFMCDEINAFGGNDSILSILEQVLIEENKDNKYRVMMLGLEKGRELENITDYEGDREHGIKTKIAQAEKKFKDKKISFLPGNFYFYKSAAGIRIQDNLITTIDDGEQEYERNKLFIDLERSLNNMYADYYSELGKMLDTLGQLSNGSITLTTLEKFKECEEVVREIKVKTTNKNNEIVERFKNAVRSIYHSSLRGAVNHNGIGKTADVYSSFQKCGGEEFQSRCEIHKAEMLALVGKVFEECTEMESICFRSIVGKINDLYSDLYSTAREEAYNLTYNELNNQTSWRIPKSFWGDGKGGYNIRVWESILSEIKSKKIDQKLKNLNIEIIFCDEIIHFLKLE